MGNDLNFKSFEELESLKLDASLIEDQNAVKKVISSFYDRRNELELLLQNKNLSKEVAADYKLELKMLKTAIKEHEDCK